MCMACRLNGREVRGDRRCQGYTRRDARLGSGVVHPAAPRRPHLSACPYWILRTHTRGCTHNPVHDRASTHARTHPYSFCLTRSRAVCSLPSRPAQFLALARRCCTPAHMLACMHARLHACACAHTQLNPRLVAFLVAFGPVLVGALLNHGVRRARAHSRTCAHAHAHVRMRAHAHACTHALHGAFAVTTRTGKGLRYTFLYPFHRCSTHARTRAHA